MRFYRPVSAAYLCVGVIVTLAIIGTGVGLSFHVANLFSGRARRGVDSLTDRITEWISNTNFTLSSITKDIVIPRQSIQVQIDASQIVNPLLDAMSQSPIPIVTPVINKTLETTVETREFVVPVTIDGISFSLATMMGEALIKEVIDKLEKFPSAAEDLTYYFLLAAGLIATTIITNAVLDKVLYGSMGLWLKADIQANVSDVRQTRSP